MPWSTDSRFASYFLPGYPAALAAVIAAIRSSASRVCDVSPTNRAAVTVNCQSNHSRDIPSETGSFDASYAANASPNFNSTSWEPNWEPRGTPATDGSGVGFIDDALPKSRIKNIRADSLIPSGPLHNFPHSTNTCETFKTCQKAPIERLSDNYDSKQNDSGMTNGLSTSAGSTESWQGVQTRRPPVSTSAPSSSSSTLNAAVMTAAAASVTNTFAISVPASQSQIHSKSSVDSCSQDVGIEQQGNPLDVTKNPYPQSAFAAAAHMRFLSAAAAAESFTRTLSNVPSSNDDAVQTASSPEESGRDDGRPTPSDLVQKAHSETWMTLTSKSIHSDGQNCCEHNCDLDASSEPESDRLISRLKGTHIKKPLNAFMLFMKEMRPRVQEECTLKESAAINQILGKKWHELPQAQQTRYYNMARIAKELHQRLYPGWSARDNYAYHARRRHRRGHRQLSHHQAFNYKPSDRSGATDSSRLNSSSFNEDGTKNEAVEVSQKIIERPDSTKDAYLPSLELRMTSSPPLSPPSQLPEQQRHRQISRHHSSPSCLPLPSQSTMPSQLSIQTARFGNTPPPPPPPPPPPLPPPPYANVLQSPSRANSTLSIPACSALEQHCKQLVHHDNNDQKHHQQLNHQYFSQGAISHPKPSPSSSAVAASAQDPTRGEAAPWNHQAIMGLKRNLYLTAAVNSGSVAAVAAAAMAVGELSGGSMKKCRARFGLEHQNLWCKPCRRKKKCVRFISEKGADDYVPHYNPYPSHFAAEAFNNKPPYPPPLQQPLPRPSPDHTIFATTRRHEGLPSDAHFRQTWVPPMNTRESLPQNTSSTVGAAASYPFICSSSKRRFPMASVPWQQQMLREYAACWGSGDVANYWGSRAARFANSSTSVCEMTTSKGDWKAPSPPLLTTQGSNYFSSIYSPPKMNRFPHVQQGITLASKAFSVRSTTSTPKSTIPATATNGRSEDNQSLRREVVPMSFGVADVMALDLGDEDSTLHQAITVAITPPPSTTTSIAAVRGDLSSTSSCPIRSSPDRVADPLPSSLPRAFCFTPF